MGNTCQYEGCRNDAGGGTHCPYHQALLERINAEPCWCAWCDEAFSRANPKYTTAQTANPEHGGEGSVCVQCYGAQHGYHVAVQPNGEIHFLMNNGCSWIGEVDA